MRKSYLIAISFLFLSSLSSFSQDLIVTKSNDSINCKITNFTQGLLYFYFQDEGVIKDTVFDRDEVKSFARGFYDYSIERPEVVIEKNSFKDFRLAINGGFARIIFYDDINNEAFESYLEDMKNGYQLSVNIVRFYINQWGVGLNYNLFRSTASKMKVKVYYDNGESAIGDMKDDISVHYFGPSINYRWAKSKKYSWHLSASIGYIKYINDFILIDDYKLTAETFGSSFSIGYDYIVSENFAIGSELSIVLGAYDKYNIESGGYSKSFKSDDEYFTTSYFDLSVGLRFNL
jgi:hypothetical protein